LLQAVQQGLQNAPVLRQANSRPDSDLVVRLEALRSWRKKTGEDMRVESDVILPRDMLEMIAQADPGTLEELAIIMKTLPYRFEQFGEAILRVLVRLKPVRKK
jgi:ribonuclease D